MSGTVTLGITVEIAFGSSPLSTSTPTWTDVSAYVSATRTITFARGYDPETDEPAAGRASFTLRNESGDFTPGTTGTYGEVRTRLLVRFRRSSTTLWTGVIESWRQTYDNGRQPLVEVQAVDRWARLQARVMTPERMVPLLRKHGAAYLWPCDDITTPLVDIVAGATIDRGTITTSAVDNPQTGNTHKLATVEGDFSTGAPSANSWSISAWMKPGSLTFGPLDAPERILIQSNVSGSPGVYVGMSLVDIAPWSITAATPADSDWHHLALTASLSGSTWTYSAYVDGALIGTDTLADGLYSNSIAQQTWDMPEGVGYVALFRKTLTAAEVAQQYAAAQLDWAGDTADERAERIAEINGGWTLTTAGDFQATMSKPDLADKPVATALLECAQAERGRIYITRDGWPALQARTERTERTGGTLAATIPASILATSTSWELDDQGLCNVVQVDRMALAEVASTINRRNESSISAYDEANRTLALWLDTDAQAIERANAEVTLYATPVPRSRTFTIDVATCQASLSESTALSIDVGSRIAISGLPDDAPVPTDAGWYVEAIEDSISHTAWTRTFTVSAALDFWVLEDSTYGELDASALLAF